MSCRPDLPQGDTLTFILSTLQELKQETLELRKDNARLRAELERKQSSRGRFSLFSSLPVEIRHKIWLYAIKEPQIHIIGNYCVSRPRVDPLKLVCHESRTLNQQLSQACYRAWIVYGIHLGIEKHHFKSKHDIIYIPSEPDVEFGCLAVFCCSQCADLDGQSLGLFCLTSIAWHKCSQSRHHYPSRLAINVEDWSWDWNTVQPHDEDDYLITTFQERIILLMKWNVQELFLVVRDGREIEKRSRPARDVRFVNPIFYPDDKSVPDFFEHPPSYDGEVQYNQKIIDKEWKRCEKQARSLLMKFKMSLSGLKAVPEQFAAEIEDVSAWKVPRIKFVQAISSEEMKDWILLYPHGDSVDGDSDSSGWQPSLFD